MTRENVRSTGFGLGRAQSGRVRRAGISRVAPLLLLLSLSGCAAVPLFGTKTAKIERADAKNPAVQILALWQASEGPGPNGVPIRGIAGQVYFFTQSTVGPVVVDGKVRIYLFDDHGTVKDQARPIGEFDFDSVGWNQRAHASALGPGYAVFIPYPRKDFHQTTCSLRVRLTPAAGPAIYSPPASVVLPGPSAKPAHGDESIIKPPPLPPMQARRQGQDATASNSTVTVQLSTPRPPVRQNVTQVSGTEDDARISLEDDVAAPEPTTVEHSGRLRMQSAKPNAAGDDED